MKITIDPDAGYCFGVKNAIEIAEKELQHRGYLFCLGDIVHNEEESQRLRRLGLEVIDHRRFSGLENKDVLIRAHGEPPETYLSADKNNIRIIDGTCPVVLKLQQKISSIWKEIKDRNGQILIFGKKDHPEVLGLIGQTNNSAIVVESVKEVSLIDVRRPVRLFAQTTKSAEEYEQLIDAIRNKISESGPANPDFRFYNTICGQVSGRAAKLKHFCEKHDVIVFISGKKSSNGRYLYNICRSVNEKSYFVSSEREIEDHWFRSAKSVGVSGATSTPLWLIRKAADHIAAI